MDFATPHTPPPPEPASPDPATPGPATSTPSPQAPTSSGAATPPERPWLTAYPPGVPATYAVPDVLLSRLLDDAANDFPDVPALVTAGGGTSTYAELRVGAERLATALAVAGVRAGDRVLVALPLGTAVPAVLFGLWRLGTTAVLTAPTTTDEELGAVVVGASAVIATSSVLDRLDAIDALPLLAIEAAGDETCHADAPTRRRPWTRRKEPSPPPVPAPTGTGRPRRADLRREDRVVRRGGAALEVPVTGDRRSLADLLAEVTGAVTPATPGTSGSPGGAPARPAVVLHRRRQGELRAVVLTHRSLVAATFQTRLWVPDIQAGRERLLVTDPFHLTVPLVFGLLTGVLSAATIVLVPDAEQATLARVVGQQRPTLWVTDTRRLSPLFGAAARRQARRWRRWRDRRQDVSSLRVVLTSGAALPPELAADVERRTGGARVRAAYGMAEAPLLHAQPVYGRVQPGSIGLPVTGTDASVVDPDDLTTPIEPGRVGMLLVRGPQIATPVAVPDLPDPTGSTDAAVAAVTRIPEVTDGRWRDGWLVTGDLAMMDPAGGFTIVEDAVASPEEDTEALTDPDAGDDLPGRVVDEMTTESSGRGSLTVEDDAAPGVAPDVPAVTPRRRRFRR